MLPALCRENVAADESESVHVTSRSIFARPMLATSLFVLAQTTTAWAQTPGEIAARRGLLEQAATASHAGNHAQALELGERAGRISMTPSLRFFLATEQRALGRLSDALGNAEICSQQAERDQTVTNRGALISQCRGLITELTPLVGRVTVQVATPAPQGLQITLAGQPLSDAFWGVPFVVTPGHVMVDATAPNRPPFHRDVDVSAGATLPVQIEMGAEIASSSPPPATTLASSAPAASTAPVVVYTPPPRTGPGPLPWIVVGVGVASLGVGIASVVIRGSALSQLQMDCPDRVNCNDTTMNRSNYATARDFSLAANITFIAGGVLVAGGLTWWLLTRNSGAAAARSAHLEFAPLTGGGWVGVGGAL